METIDRFSIGDLLRFRIIDRSGRLNRIFSTFNQQYENFITNDASEEYDLTINIGSYRPELKGCYASGDGKFYFKENYLHVPHESLKGAKWGFEIKGLNEKKTEINVDCNELGRIFIEGYVIDFMIHLKLSEIGYPIIHASSVKKANRGFLFASRGGGGKTTVALRLASSEFDFMGDNYTILHNGTLIGLPTSLNIFTYNISPRIMEKMSTKERRMFKLKGGLYNATGGYAKFFTKINPQRIFEQIGGSAKLDLGFFLLPTKQNGNIDIKEIEASEFARRNLFNQKLEFPHFDRYIREYSFFFPEADFSRHWEGYSVAIVNHLSKNARYYLVTVPVRFDDSVMRRILSKVSDRTFEQGEIG